MAGEAEYQLMLQLVILWKDGLPGTLLNDALRIFSLATSSLSCSYGGASVKLRSLTKKEPEMLKTLHYWCLKAIHLSNRFLIVIGCLVLVFATESVYTTLATLFYAIFMCALLFFYHFCVINKVFPKDFGGQKRLENFIQRIKFNLIFSLSISLSGIVISIVFLTSISSCSILFINCEEEYKEDGQRRTMNFSLTLLVTATLSLLLKICELFSIKFRNKSFMDWVFILAQEEQMKVKTQEENANSESGNLIEDIDNENANLESGNMMEDNSPIESEIIKLSTIERRLNENEEHIVVSVNSDENLLNEATEMKGDDNGKQKNETENKKANSESLNFMKDINPIESDKILQSINQSKWNQDEDYIVINIHSNENEEGYQLNEAPGERGIGKHGKETKNKDANLESDNIMEDISPIESELIQKSNNQSRWNPDDEYNVKSIHSNKNEDCNQVDEAADMKEGDVSEHKKEADHNMETLDQEDREIFLTEIIIELQ